MPSVYLATNRFGLGRRYNDPPVGDAPAWLTRQIDDFDPRPAALSALAGRSAIADAYLRYREDRKEQRTATMADKANAADSERELARLSRSDIRRYYIDASNARLATAVGTPTPFAERLVHFWANHFAVSADKLPVIGFAGNFEFDAIRPHIMGKFSDLLTAAVRHPAMLLFLDQAQSFGPDSPVAVRRRQRSANSPGLNENLAREIMELHTLGVRSGYSQTDVTNFAKALTGLTVAGLGRGAGQRLMPANARAGETVFIEPLHQPGAQSIMGQRYNQSGAKQAEAVLLDLATHPATARHIATKLARHFTTDQPPAALVDRLADDFQASGGDLPSLYRTLIASPETWIAVPPKFKSPWDWTISMLRGLGIDAVDRRPNVTAMFTQLRQPIWRPGSPAGYDDMVATWAGSAALMQRVELASRVAARIGDRVDARTLAPLLLSDALNGETSQAIARADSAGQALTLLFASPAFLRR